jgi:hypothetical protein
MGNSDGTLVVWIWDIWLAILLLIRVEIMLDVGSLFVVF